MYIYKKYKKLKKIMIKILKHWDKNQKYKNNDKKIIVKKM